jgi:phosphatidylserine decarboxylase
MIHKEGYRSVFLVGSFCILLLAFAFFVIPDKIIIKTAIILISLFLLFVVPYFFRNPKRISEVDENLIYSPADGRVVVIEETEETEYFKEKRLMISVFMSIWDSHINWDPVNGTYGYYKYHPGKHFVAWHPKSSFDNEHASTVIKTSKNVEILVRQIAGAVARRIVSYVKKDNPAKQGKQLGFIKFGSRVDLFLPLDAKVKVDLAQKVKGNKTVLATFN